MGSKAHSLADRRDDNGSGGASARTGYGIATLLSLALLAAIGWAYLGVMIADHAAGGGVAALGPGMGLIDRLVPSGTLGPFAGALVEALCRPNFGTQAAAVTLADFVLVAAMWVAMVLAMMLPTAAPMVAAYSTYAAARRTAPAGAPFLVLAGYLAVWIAFAIAAAAVQVALTRLALIDAAMATASPLFAGAIFIAAGAYQFSALKLGCADRCRRPEAFFGEEADTAAAVFWLGLEQGRSCTGCCWVMMLLMFAVGTMNVVWMAVLGAVMAVEKIAATARFSRIVGVALLGIGVAMIAAAVMARWPGL